jgi:hypothetical protein
VLSRESDRIFRRIPTVAGLNLLWQPFLGRCCMPVSLIISFQLTIKRKGREIWVEVLRSALTRLH